MPNCIQLYLMVELSNVWIFFTILLNDAQFIGMSREIKW